MWTDMDTPKGCPVVQRVHLYPTPDKGEFVISVIGEGAAKDCSISWLYCMVARAKRLSHATLASIQ